MNVDPMPNTVVQKHQDRCNEGLRRGRVLEGGRVGIRDSKNPDGPALIFASAEWDAFTSSVRNGGFDASQA
ncbi:DUF397 domain-containing protein [Nocardia africana]|uniref:DUF397 domain-containing protein n=1 Tax=Nocardia africana TaxID=134964 RepID=A0ABW6NHC9_9NOCA